MTDRSRIHYKAAADKVMSAEEAAAFITRGDHVGMSGFTGFGHPKAVPTALVRRATDAAARGDRFGISVWTGSSTAPELDGALAAVDGIDLRMPYQSDPVTRPPSWTACTTSTTAPPCPRTARQSRSSGRPTGSACLTCAAR